MEHWESFAGLVVLAFALTELIKSNVAWFNSGIKSIALLVVVTVGLTFAGVKLGAGIFDGMSFGDALIQVTLAAIGLAAFSYDTFKAIRAKFK